MFKGHPYAKDLKGTSTALKSFTRQGLLRRHTQNLTKEKILITCCGDIQEKQLLNTLEPLLQDLTRNGRATNYQQNPVFNTDGNRSIHVPFKREQTHLFIGIPTKGFHHKETLPLKS